MIPAIGAMNTAYADMKFRNVEALERIIQGTIAQPPTSIAKITPRRILKYLGNKDVMSVEETSVSRERKRRRSELTIAKGYGIRRNIDANLSKCPERCAEKSSNPSTGTSLPLRQNIQWTPKYFAIEAF